MRRGLVFVLGLACASVFVPPGFADIRHYVWTYEYMTLPQGTAEVEYYVTHEIPNAAKSSINIWKHWLEWEYGISDKWDVAVYQMGKQKNTASGSTSEYDGFKIRTRYRFGEKGLFVLDPLLYLEYIRDDDFSKPSVGEAKLVFGKSRGRLDFAYNQIMKRNLEKEGKTDHEYAVGAGYAVTPLFHLGVESKGNYSKEKYAVGPALSFVIKKLWFSLGAAWGLNEKTDDIQARVIVGMPF